MATLLLLQDDEAATRVVRAALAHAEHPPFELECVRDCAAALARLADTAAPAVSAMLVDLQLAEGHGIELIERLIEAAPMVPVVVLSTRANESMARLAMQHGAQDYLLKERLDDYVLPKTMLSVFERAAIANALHEERERAQVTLNSIGDAVISTDADGKVAYLNAVAERLTGWPVADALGQPLELVFRIIDEATRRTIPNPMDRATHQDATVSLPATCILVRRDGFEYPIEDSAAPIHGVGGIIRGAVMVFRDVSAARAASLKLAHYAQHDSLTDLPNRSLLNERLSRAILLAGRNEGALAVLYLDLDRFKLINDSLGHLVGDHLLQAVAARLTASVRETDTVCRLGGDEFVVLLHELARPGDAAGCAGKVLQALQQQFLVDGHELHVTASIGVALHPGDGSEAEALLQSADIAMYEAKARGRNGHQFYRAELNAHASERQALENSLRHAIDRNELSLHYQPIIDVATRGACGAEALVRWQHPTLGAVSAAQLVAIAEDSGLIIPIGHWVLREACRQAVAWQRAGLACGRMAVNISAVELRSPGFTDSVAGILAETGLDPRHLELELTETFLMQDVRSTRLVLAGLRQLGISIALDDFGTGYSSLSYMRRFPIDTLKVDRSFVHDLTSDTGDAGVVCAIINMGLSLDMRVVAEGVESHEQLQFLVQHGCQEAQGFHFSQPLDAAGCAAYLAGAPAWRALRGTTEGARR